MSYVELITSNGQDVASATGAVIAFPLEQCRHRAIQLMRLHLLRREIAELKAEQKMQASDPPPGSSAEARALLRDPLGRSWLTAASNSEIRQQLEQAMLDASERDAPERKIDLMRRLYELAS